MLETMYAAPGRGLAAPQVGVLLRLFVMDAGWKAGTPTPMVMIDPQIEAVGAGVSVNAEGCLSIPGLMIDVARPDAVRLSWSDLEGVRHEREFTGFEALCAQHEIDHLDGTLTLDHLEAGTRARVLKDYSGALA
jgi:peptide deformylase